MAFEKTFGSQFQLGDDDLSGTPVYTTVAQVKSIGDWELEAEMADTTSHDSPGGYREKFPTGIFNQEDVEMVLNYDPADGGHDNITGLMNVHLNKTLRAYKIILPDTSSTTWTFEAYVTKFATNIGSGEDQLMATVTMAITGQPTLS